MFSVYVDCIHASDIKTSDNKKERKKVSKKETIQTNETNKRMDKKEKKTMPAKIQQQK